VPLAAGTTVRPSPGRQLAGRPSLGLRSDDLPAGQATAPGRLRRLAGYGAVINVTGDIYEESRTSAEHSAAETGALLVHPFDRPMTVAGAGTVAAEFCEQVPDLDTMLIAVGGGGLLAGTLAALDGASARPVAIEPLSARCLGAARRPASRSTCRYPGPPSIASAYAGLAGSHSMPPSRTTWSTST
jgi:threonine dehydratase